MSRTRNILLFITKIFVIGILISGVSILILYLTEKSISTNSIIVTNLDTNSFSIYWKTKKLTKTSAKITSPQTSGNQIIKIQSDDRDKSKSSSEWKSHHTTFFELESDTEYTVQIRNPNLPDFIPQIFNRFSVKTSKTSSTDTQTADRVYGIIQNEEALPIKNALVFLSLDGEKYLSTFTNQDGGYSFDVNKLSPDEPNYLERIFVDAENYQSQEFLAQSTYDQPVPSIQLKTEKQDSEGSSLISPAYAWGGNTCYSEGTLGGIRIQCNEEIHWMKELNPNNCPDTSKVRVGLVAHTDKTFLFKPESVYLEIVDKETGTAVISNIPNGDYISTSLLEFGKEYTVKSYDGSPSKECSNEDDSSVVKLAEKTEEYQTVSAMTTTEQKCSKFGEHMAVWIPRDYVDFKEISDIGMKWAEVITPDANDYTLEQVYYDTVKDANDAGVTLILRVDNATDGKKYARNLIKLYDKLLADGSLPPEGLYVHAGHNEPNTAEYKDPNTEASFVADTIKTIREEGYISRSSGDSGIKLLSPNMDLVNTEDAPGSHYTAKTYLNEMLKNQEFADEAKHLYTISVNHFMVGGHDSSSAVDSFHNYLTSNSKLPNKIFITETGRIDETKSWDQFKNELKEMSAFDFVEVILLFDSFGFNPDKDFEYHKDLWNNHNLIKDLISFCTKSDYKVPQEGSTSFTVDLQKSGNTKPPEDTYVPVAPDSSDVQTQGDFDGNFNGSFVSDGAAELSVPSGWHVWFDQCSGNCGDYACNPDDAAHCRRPEYQQIDGGQYANRVVSGKALKMFTTFGTHNAGVYTTVSIPGTGKRDIKFSISATSWSDPGDPGHDQGVVDSSYHGAVGIDPNGGVDPHSASIVWSSLSTLPNIKPENSSPQWTNLEVTTSTESDKITIFTRANNQYAYRNSDSYWDEAKIYVDGNEISQITPGNQPIASVLGTSTLTAQEPGEYEISSDKYHVLSTYVSKFEDSKDMEIKFFYDKNGNLTKDDGEEFVEDVEGIEISKVSEVFKLNLKRGRNFISFPIYIEKLSKANKVIKEIREQGVDAVALDSYYSGKWISYTFRDNKEFGQDFDIQPGRGYVLTIRKDGEATFRGNSFTKPVRIYMKEGWNLVAVHGSEKSYTAEKLIDSINKESTLTANNLSTWSASEQKYSGVQYEPEDKKYYGIDFPISPKGGYFVRIDDGVDYFTPE